MKQVIQLTEDEEDVHRMLLELELRQPILIEKTSKSIKRFILIGLIIMILSVVPRLLLQDSRLAYSNSDIGYLLFISIAVIGTLIWLYGTAKAYWYHG